MHISLPLPLPRSQHCNSVTINQGIISNFNDSTYLSYRCWTNNHITNDEKGIVTIFTDIHKAAILLHNDTNALKRKQNL